MRESMERGGRKKGGWQGKEEGGTREGGRREGQGMKKERRREGDGVGVIRSGGKKSDGD